MSLFLGKIHYWLYDKILWFDSIETEMIKWANQKNLPIEQWMDEMKNHYGEPIGGEPLEDIIDTSNIHGWLQGKISVVESRQAYLVTKIIESNSDYKDELKKIFHLHGEKAANDYKEEFLESPEQVYNALNDYILEGMPCDRVNEVLHSDMDEIKWNRTTCLHEKHWDAVSGNVDHFYELREAWVESFVNSLQGNFQYEKISANIQRIYR